MKRTELDLAKRKLERQKHAIAIYKHGCEMYHRYLK